jgi:hypothetical protein
MCATGFDFASLRFFYLIFELFRRVVYFVFHFFTLILCILCKIIFILMYKYNRFRHITIYIVNKYDIT